MADTPIIIPTDTVGMADRGLVGLTNAYGNIPEGWIDVLISKIR